MSSEFRNRAARRAQQRRNELLNRTGGQMKNVSILETILEHVFALDFLVQKQLGLSDAEMENVRLAFKQPAKDVIEHWQAASLGQLHAEAAARTMPPCESCGGTGQDPQADPAMEVSCERCNGTGKEMQ